MYLQTQAAWEITWNFNRPNYTYHTGEHINITCTFRNTGSTPIHLRRMVAWFDWLPQGYLYQSECNIFCQPNQLAFLSPITNIQAEIPPFDVPKGHHSFKIGVDYRYWNGNQWVETFGIQWATPHASSLDQVLVDYPPARNFKNFIIHSEKDIAYARMTEDYIKRCGQTPYIAESPENPELGKKLWEEKIERALQTSNAVLLLWTQNCISSRSVQYELQRAKQLGKRIIPAIENNCNPPEAIKDLVYVRFDSTNPEAIKTIVNSLLSYESEVNQQRNQQILGIIALLALGAAAGAALSSN